MGIMLLIKAMFRPQIRHWHFHFDVAADVSDIGLVEIEASK